MGARPRVRNAKARNEHQGQGAWSGGEGAGEAGRCELKRIEARRRQAKHACPGGRAMHRHQRQAAGTAERRGRACQPRGPCAACVPCGRQGRVSAAPASGVPAATRRPCTRRPGQARSSWRPASCRVSQRPSPASLPPAARSCAHVRRGRRGGAPAPQQPCQLRTCTNASEGHRRRNSPAVGPRSAPGPPPPPSHRRDAPAPSQQQRVGRGGGPGLTGGAERAPAPSTHPARACPPP